MTPGSYPPSPLPASANRALAPPARPLGRDRLQRVDIRHTGVGVLDRAVAVLTAVERGAASLRQLTEATGLSRTTTHRIATSLESHGLLARDASGWRLGPRLFALSSAARRDLPFRDLARPSLSRLSQVTGESAQLYLRDGDRRLCIDVVESDQELRTIVPVGASLPLTLGSAGVVFLAYETPRALDRLLVGAEPPEHKPTGSMPWPDRLRQRAVAMRRRGWSDSVEERERGVASVSAPVTDGANRLVAVVSISGPVQRLGRTPGRHYASAVTTAAGEIEAALGAPGGR